MRAVATILFVLGCVPPISAAPISPPDDGASRHYASYPPYPSEPADPWIAVAGDQPVRWSEREADEWRVRANDFACTAAHDHCLPAHGWFTENDEHRARGGERVASLHVFGPRGPTHPSNVSNPFRGGPYTAYRTVPATQTNLVPGALAIVFPRPNPHPRNGAHAIEQRWHIAPVESVDLDAGTVKLAGHADTHLLSAARVAVLSWQVDGKVQLLGTTPRDRLAVKKHEVFLPR